MEYIVSAHLARGLGQQETHYVVTGPCAGTVAADELVRYAGWADGTRGNPAGWRIISVNLCVVPPPPAVGDAPAATAVPAVTFRG